MKKIRFAVIVFIVFISNGMFAAENNIIFEKANELYHNKYYDSAAQLYQQMIEDGYCHADLYYNAGNAYYRSHKTGMAVWSFKKALQLDNNKNYRDNLQIAQAKIEQNIQQEEEIFFIRWWKGMYNVLSVNQWAVTSLVMFMITIVVLILRNIAQKKVLNKGIVQIMIAVTLICILFLFVKYDHDTSHYHGIVIQNNTIFTSASKSLSDTLSEGIEVEFLSRRNNQLMVKLPDGRTGAIPESAFKKL